MLNHVGTRMINLAFGDGWNPTHQNGSFRDGSLLGLPHYSLYQIILSMPNHISLPLSHIMENNIINIYKP